LVVVLVVGAREGLAALAAREGALALPPLGARGGDVAVQLAEDVEDLDEKLPGRGGEENQGAGLLLGRNDPIGGLVLGLVPKGMQAGDGALLEERATFGVRPGGVPVEEGADRVADPLGPP